MYKPSENELEKIIQTAVREVVHEVAPIAVKEALLSLGLDSRDAIETQKHMVAIRHVSEMFSDPEYQSDLAHLRRWRKSMETISDAGTKTAIGIVITGLLAIVVLGVRSWIEKHPL